MAVTRVGSPSRTDSSSGAAFSAALPQTPTNNNTLTLAVLLRGASNTPSVATPSGWTPGDSITVSVNLGEQLVLALFYKNASSTDTAPTITPTQANTAMALIEEWSGLPANAVLNTTGKSSSTNGTSPLTASQTTTNDVNWSYAVAAFSNVMPTSTTWGGGQTVDYALGSANFLGVTSSVQSLTTKGAKSPSITYSGSTGNSAIVGMTFIETPDAPPPDNLQRAGTLYPINTTTVDTGTGIDLRALSDTQPGATDSSQSIQIATQNSNAERTFDPATANDVTVNNAQTTNGKKGWAIPAAGMAPGNASCVTRLVAQNVTVNWGGVAAGTGLGNTGVNDVLTPKASLWKYNTSTDTATLIAGNAGTAISKAANLAYSNSAYTAQVVITIPSDVTFAVNEVLMLVIGGNLACGQGFLNGARTTTWTVDVDVSTTNIVFGTVGLRLLCSFNYAGSVSSSAALKRVPTKAIGGSNTPAGVIARSVFKTLAGATTPSGTKTLLVTKLFSGSASSSGALRRVPNKPVSGSIVSSGLLTKVPFLAKGGTISPAGVNVLLVTKKLTGSAGPTGALVRIPFLKKSGTIGPTGALVRTQVKYFGGTIASSGALSKSLAKFFSGAITSSGVLNKLTIKRTTGTIAPTGFLRNTISKNLKGFLYGPSGDGSGGSTTIVNRIVQLIFDD